MADRGYQDKPPFDQLVESMSPGLLRQTVGLRSGEGYGFTFDPAAKKLRSVLKRDLQCELDKFGSCLGLPAARVAEIKSAGDGDSKKQTDYLLLAWVESRGEEATFEEALRALYAADDIQTLKIFVEAFSDSGKSVERDGFVHKKAAFAGSVLMPSPHPQTHFLAENEDVELSQKLGSMAVSHTRIPQRLQSETEVGTPVELPPEVALQAPQEETALAKKMVRPVEPSSAKVEGDSKSAEVHAPMEETWMSHPVESSTTVVTSFTPPQMVTAVNDTTFEGNHAGHEMVSGDRRMERIQSELEDLMKNMRRIDCGLQEVKSEHEVQSVYSKKRSDELDSKVRQLEEDNALLKSTVISLREELEDTKQKLKEALEEAVKLREDNVGLTDLLSEERARMKEDRERFREESERMQRRAATTEREKAELRDNLEEQTTQWRTRQERYERELTEMKAVLSSVREEIRMFRDQNTTDSPGNSSVRTQGGETGEWSWKQMLGAGGFGEVFEAERRGSTDRFAAKRMTLKDSDLIDEQEEIVSAFFKEMKALKECRHPRVVQYYDRVIESVGGRVYFYLIMEFMSQGSLSDLMKREGKLDELRVKRFTLQLLKGLLYLHQRNIIHRDIKCSNILLDENGDIKLADFGCVKFKKSKVSSGAKMTGTAWWMAPELVPGGKQTDAASDKSDVWSVGATVVEMLTGRRPFAEYNEKMAVIFGLGQKSLSLDNLIQGPGFSDEVQVFLKLCINWEPSERATVTELLNTSFVSS